MSRIKVVLEGWAVTAQPSRTTLSRMAFFSIFPTLLVCSGLLISILGTSKYENRLFILTLVYNKVKYEKKEFCLLPSKGSKFCTFTDWKVDKKWLAHCFWDFELNSKYLKRIWLDHNSAVILDFFLFTFWIRI